MGLETLFVETRYLVSFDNILKGDTRYRVFTDDKSSLCKKIFVLSVVKF